MNYTEFRKHLELERVSKPMIEAATTAFSALFEGLNPAQKTRRAIRQFMEEPPGGWDSVAMNEKEEPFVSQHGNEMNWAAVLEGYIRGEFFHRRGMPDKYEPGIARIALLDMGLWPENLYDYRSNKPEPKEDLIPDVRRIVGLLSGEAHINDFSFDLEGMGLDELLRRFGSNSSESTSTDMVDTGSTNYRVVRIKNFAQSQEFYHYFDSNPQDRWCIIENDGYWNRYTKRGKNTAYYLIAPGAEDMTAEEGENCPKDEYGLSLIGIMIGPRGTLEHCCVRWNYSHGASDHELDVEELEELLGRPLSVLCPPKTSLPGAISSYDELVRTASASDNPMAVYAENGGRVTEIGYGRTWNEYRIVQISPNDADLDILIDASTGQPVFEVEGYEPTSVQVLDDNAIRVIFTREDDWGDSESIYALVGHNGEAHLIGGSSSESEGFPSMEDLRQTNIPGIYELRIWDTGENSMIIDIEGHQLTGLHKSIDTYKEGNLIVCDEDRELDEAIWEDDSEDVKSLSYRLGEPEVLTVNPETHEVIPLVAPGYCHDMKFLETAYVSKDSINIAYNDGDDFIVITHGKRVKVCEFESRDYTQQYLMRGDTIIVLEMEDGTYSIFSLKRCEFIATDLDNPPSKGVYKKRGSEFAEMYSKDGPMLGGKYTAIRHVDSMGTPYNYYSGIHNDTYDSEGIYACTDRNGDTYLINMGTQKPIYDVPVPKNAYPYSEQAIVVPTDTSDGDTRYVVTDLEGNKLTPPFKRIGLTEGDHPAIYGGSMFSTDWMMLVDPHTGKPLTPKITGMTCLGTHSWSRALYKVRSEDGKYTIYRVTSPIKSGQLRKELVPTNIGWVDSVVVVNPTNIALVTNDGEKYLYDLNGDTKLDWEPSADAIRKHLIEYVTYFDRENGTNWLRKMNINDFNDYYVGEFISENPWWCRRRADGTPTWIPEK